MPRRITPDDSGCWIDEINGWSVHWQVAELAMSLGWLGSDDPTVEHAITRRQRISETMRRRGELRAILAAYKRGDTATAYRGMVVDDIAGTVINQGGIADEATDYLNCLAPEGYAFGWHDCSLFLQSDEWWSEDG
jgi:hypothetical protein